MRIQLTNIELISDIRYRIRNAKRDIQHINNPIERGKVLIELIDKIEELTTNQDMHKENK